MYRALHRLGSVVVFLACLMLPANAQNSAGPPPPGPAGPPPATNAGGKAVIEKIGFKGNATFSDAVLLKAVHLHVGQTMSPELIKQAVDRLVNFYRSHGANLSVWPNIDPDGGRASIEFVIDEHGTRGDAGPAPH
jgi:hypothetical protein